MGEDGPLPPRIMSPGIIQQVVLGRCSLVFYSLPPPPPDIVAVYKANTYLLSILRIFQYFRLSRTVGCEDDRLCGIVVRVLGYRSGGLGSNPGTTRKK
jgi:hypothetical protein